MSSKNMDSVPESALSFDPELWKKKDGDNFPYRDKMLNDVVYNEFIRSLDKEGIHEQLGNPSRYGDDENYLYYLIKRQRIGLWTLHTKTMVIKLTEEGTVEWIKIHE